MLVHHRCGYGEVHCRRAALAHWLWIQLAFNRQCVIDNLQTRSAGEQAKVARMLRRRRMMQKFRGITFHNSIDVMHTKLTLINKEPICRRFAFEKRDSSFDSPNPADERPDQQRDDAEMRDEKRKMMFAQ